MSQRELVWSSKAVLEVRELLKRRSDHSGILACIEEHLLAVAADPGIARISGSPLRELVYRFQCRDHDTLLYILAVFAFAPPDKIVVIHCDTQQL